MLISIILTLSYGFRLVGESGDPVPLLMMMMIPDDQRFLEIGQIDRDLLNNAIFQEVHEI